MLKKEGGGKGETRYSSLFFPLLITFLFALGVKKRKRKGSVKKRGGEARTGRGLESKILSFDSVFGPSIGTEGGGKGGENRGRKGGNAG